MSTRPTRRIRPGNNPFLTGVPSWTSATAKAARQERAQREYRVQQQARFDHKGLPRARKLSEVAI